MLALGTIAKKTAQQIKKELEKEDNPLQVLGILRKYIRSVVVEEMQKNKNTLKREVILSGYLVK